MANNKDINEFLDIFLKLRDLTATTDANTITSKQTKSIYEVNKLQLVELRRFYDTVYQSFEHLRSRALALLGGEIAIVTFLFASESGVSPFNNHELYSIVFASLGVFALALSFLLFIVVLSPTGWTHPPDNERLIDEEDYINLYPEHFIKYLRKAYIDATNTCTIKVSLKAKKVTWGLYSLSIGVFILLFMKYGGHLIII